MPRKKNTPHIELVEPTPYVKSSVEDIVHTINMKYGDNGPVARLAQDAWDSQDLRRSSRITSLDIATGGGLVAGKVHQIDGREGVGKNVLLYHYFAEVQRKYGDKACLGMACFETFVDKHFAQKCGCKIAMSLYDIDVTQRARAARGEPPLTEGEISEALSCPEVGKFVVFQGSSEKVLDGVIEAVQHNVFQLIGIDSWDMMLTTAEDTARLDEVPQVASPSTVQTRWSKKLIHALNPIYRCPECGYSPLKKNVSDYAAGRFKYACANKSSCSWTGLQPAIEVNETTLYCIRQVRARINMGGASFRGRPYESKGSHALRHLNYIRVTLQPGEYLKEGNRKVGKEVTWEITKAKGGAREGEKGMYNFFFDPPEVDLALDLFLTAVDVGALEKVSPNTYAVPDGQDDKPIKGKEAVIDRLADSPEFFDRVQRLCFIKSGLGHVRFT